MECTTGDAGGTVHRMEMQKAELQFDRLQEVLKPGGYSLVIHGSSGVWQDEDRLVPVLAPGKLISERQRAHA